MHPKTVLRLKTVRVLLLAMVPALLLGLAGCGKKGDPLPPLRDVPLPTDDLTVFQQGRLLVFQMTYPSTTISGLALGGIDSLELLQLVKPATGEEVATIQEAEFEASAEPLLTLRGVELEAALTGNRVAIRVPLADELPEEPSVSYYGVRTSRGDETSDISNVVGLLAVEPPPAPQDLAATARPRSIDLAWKNEGEIEGFDVFRREASERGYGQPIQRLGADARSYSDSGVRYGKRYIYTVRAISNLEPLIWSDATGEREIDYEDRFAPPLPESFVALGERARVRLRWEASRADDVAGYVLYRKEPRRDEFRRVNEDLITGVEHLNRNLVSGFSYDFRIQVVDRVGNESELSEPVSASVR